MRMTKPKYLITCSNKSDDTANLQSLAEALRSGSARHLESKGWFVYLVILKLICLAAQGLTLLSRQRIFEMTLYLV